MKTIPSWVFSCILIDAFKKFTVICQYIIIRVLMLVCYNRYPYNNICISNMLSNNSLLSWNETLEGSLMVVWSWVYLLVYINVLWRTLLTVMKPKVYFCVAPLQRRWLVKKRDRQHNGFTTKRHLLRRWWHLALQILLLMFRLRTTATTAMDVVATFF